MRTLGIDVGTSALKAVLVDVARPLKVLASVNKPYAADGAPTRDPAVWARLARQAVDALAAEARPDAIGFTGQMHGLIALDQRGRLAAPVKLWLDMDGAAALEAFVACNGGAAAMVRESGNVPLPDFVLAKWLQALAADPELPGRVDRLLTVKDFVRLALDPRGDFAIDANEACGTQLYDPFAGAWSEALTNAARLPRRALPPIRDAAARAGDAGSLSAELKGVPLVLGVGDQASAKRSLGPGAAGLVSLSLGTSGVLSFTVRRADLPAAWDGAFHLFPAGYGESFEMIGTVPSFGGTLRWLSRLTGKPVDELDRLAATTRPGAAAALFMPYLAGAGAPHPHHDIRAELLGLDEHLTPELLVRSVYDGMAHEFRAILDEARTVGARVDRVVLSGGAARLPTLAATLAAFFDVDCQLAGDAEGSAIGAALLAADHLDRGNRAGVETVRVQPAERVPLNSAWLEKRREIITASTAGAD
jgi:sugar (pentulose or hexulose) kinase